uniref:Uncharacterized protein LOC104238512 n=1 Tax=Nicotiana sylvestris TaxID=4096 RepID=A0A1U7XGI6_NICSY|nr:PREDICTED: uncharacterized protein LOC104238512 [Nicotiana sylvestris]
MVELLDLVLELGKEEMREKKLKEKKERKKGCCLLFFHFIFLPLVLAIEHSLSLLSNDLCFLPLKHTKTTLSSTKTSKTQLKTAPKTTKNQLLSSTRKYLKPAQIPPQKCSKNSHQTVPKNTPKAAPKPAKNSHQFIDFARSQVAIFRRGSVAGSKFQSVARLSVAVSFGARSFAYVANSAIKEKKCLRLQYGAKMGLFINQIGEAFMAILE